MKIKRQKRVRKLLMFYKSNFGYEPPYQVLLDGTFCKAALSYQVNIREQMPKYFDSEVKLVTTRCILNECEALGTLLYGPLKVLRQFDIWKCKHSTPIPACRCLQDIIRKGKKHKLFIATQDRELSDKVRKKGGIPLIFIDFKAINLEAPSEASISETKDTSVSDKQHENLDKIKKTVFGETEVKKAKKRKGPSQPNPLSCKKKKPKIEVVVTKPEESAVKQKRKRKRKKQTAPAVDN